MFLRILQLRVKPTEIQGFVRLYEDRIVPALRSASGCFDACLVQSIRRPEKVLSVTLWNSEEDSSAYERSGLFMQLVGSARFFFADSTEWRLTLSKDFTLEHTPVSAEPVVGTYSVSTTTGGRLPPQQKHLQMFMRIVSLHHKPGKLEEFKDLYQREIIPTLIATQGCQYACLSTPADGSSESVSVTLWNSRADAEEYERKGTFRRLLQKVRHTLSDLSQLQLESIGTRLPSTTSEDVAVEGFQFITGMNVQH